MFPPWVFDRSRQRDAVSPIGAHEVDAIDDAECRENADLALAHQVRPMPCLRSIIYA